MAYFVRIRRKCASPKTIRWSTHSRRIDPISLSAKPFCQGEPGAMGLSRMPIVRNRCVGQSLRWQELPRFSARSKDDPAVAKPATPLLSLRWTLSAKRACVVITGTEPDRAQLLAPASADGPPRGLGGGGAMLRRPRRDFLAPTLLRGVWHVQAQRCAHP